MYDFIVKPDKFDYRDYRVSFPKQDALKSLVDLRKWASPIEDQLHLGSCVGQSIVGAFELMVNMLYPERFVDLSRLFVYYNARLLDNMTSEDVGAYVRNGIKATNIWGVCSENIWPYLIEKFSNNPGLDSYDDGKNRIIEKYYRIESIEDIKVALNKNYPVVISMEVFDSFYDLDNGARFTLPMPSAYENIIGGHAVTIVGYELNEQMFIVRNSFGESWGDSGYFLMPFEYAKKYVWD